MFSGQFSNKKTCIET